MAFPFVEGRNTGNSGGDVNSFVAPLPAGIQAGETLIVTVAGKADVSSWSSGWIQFLNHSRSSSEFLHAAWKKAVGGDSGPTITFSTTQECGTVSHRISAAADPTVTAPQSGGLATGISGTNPNPGSLTPSGGPKDFLWIPCSSHTFAVEPVTAPPNYTDLQEDGILGIFCATAERLLNASSENPGEFTRTSDGEWAAATIAVHPAGAVGPTITPDPTLISSQVAKEALSMGHGVIHRIG